MLVRGTVLWIASSDAFWNYETQNMYVQYTFMYVVNFL